MSKFVSISVRELIQGLEEKKFYLPSIQRTFVWETDQIEKLFDSLMRGFPIGSFLFWKTPTNAINNFQFYEFIRAFHKLHPENKIALFDKHQQEFQSILDGQQRITSLNIGLKGSYWDKIKYKPPGDPNSYIEKKLYLNILNTPAPGDDLMYYFKFLTEDELKESNDEFLKLSEEEREKLVKKVKELQDKSSRTPEEERELNDKSKALQFWFKVGDIMEPPFFGSDGFELAKVLAFLNNSGINMAMSQVPLTMLHRLADRINKDLTLNYYQEESKDLDQVVNIFVRVNSGGTVLSSSDLFLSFATASLQGLNSNINARDEIEKFINRINGIGGRKNFSIEKDTVLKAMLVLCREIKDIKFSIKNFNRDNMKIIKDHWNDVLKAIELTVKLIDSFGLNGSNFASNNSLIPIAHYIYNRRNDDKIIDSAVFKEDRYYIRYWFMVATLTKIFGAATDGTLKSLRDILNESSTLPKFPLERMLLLDKIKYGKLKVTKKRMANIIIENILDMQYKNRYLYMAFSAIYSFDFKLANQMQLNVDHIFPSSKCKSLNELKKFGITNPKNIDFYQKNCDSIVNLQLLRESPNKSKNNRYFDEWLDDEYENDPTGKFAYLTEHCLPTDDNYNFKFDNFEKFFADRKELLKQRITKTFEKWKVL